MIFKLNFEDKTEFAQAKNCLHLITEYQEEIGEAEDILEVIRISEEEAKTIMLSNNEYDFEKPEDEENVKEFSLWDTCHGDDFCIIGSTEWD